VFPTGQKFATVGNTALLLELLQDNELTMRRKNGVILVGQELEV
jgi:hypothetical protein